MASYRQYSVQGLSPTPTATLWGLNISAALPERGEPPSPSRPLKGDGMWLYLRLFLVGLRLVGLRRDLVLENLVLRQQLTAYTRVPRRTALQPADRRFWSTVARGWVGWRRHVHVVEPATVVRWHRNAWRRYWRWRSRTRGGPAAPASLPRPASSSSGWPPRIRDGGRNGSFTNCVPSGST